MPAVGPLTWQLCARADQEVLATLDRREAGATVQIGRHTARLAEVTLALDDVDAPLASVADTLLRVKAEDWTDPVFNGRINGRKIEVAGEQETLTLTAADPLLQLETALVLVLNTAFNPDAYAYVEYTATQELLIIADLISDTADNDHGIAIGSTPATTVRTLSFPAGSGVAEAILSITGLGSCEFELTPTEATDGTIATLNGFNGEQGTDKSATVIAKIGISRDGDNCVGLSYEEALAGMCNAFLAIGDQDGTATKDGLDYPLHPAHFAEHATSIATYGRIERSEALSGVAAAAQLEAYAEAIVSANAYPIKSFAVTLDPAGDISFGPDGDCYMGDVIALEAGLPRETLSLNGRIGGATLEELEGGEVEVDLDCEVEASAGVAGSAISVVMDPGDGTAPTPPEVPPPPRKSKGGKGKDKKGKGKKK